MKKSILTLIGITLSLFIFAQDGQLRTGTIVQKQESVGLNDNFERHRTTTPSIKVYYIVMDKITKELFLAESTELEIPIGGQVTYKLKQMGYQGASIVVAN